MVRHPPSARPLCAFNGIHEWPRGRHGGAKPLPAVHRIPKTLRPHGSIDVSASAIIADDPHDEPKCPVPQPHGPSAQPTHIQRPARGLRTVSKTPLFSVVQVLDRWDYFFCCASRRLIPLFFLLCSVGSLATYGHHTSHTDSDLYLRGSMTRTSLLVVLL